MVLLFLLLLAAQRKKRTCASTRRRTGKNRIHQSLNLDPLCHIPATTRSIQPYLSHSFFDSSSLKMVNVTYSPEGNPIYTLPDGTAALYNTGDVAWIIVATALVFIMVRARSPVCGV